MADVTALQEYHIKLSDREFKTVLRALGQMAGIKIQSSAKVRHEQQVEAAELNKMLLRVRAQVLKEQLKVAEGALEKADEFVVPDPPSDSLVPEEVSTFDRAMRATAKP